MGLVDGCFEGGALSGLPIRKWPAVTNERSAASSVLIGARGLEFNMDSTSTSTE